MIVFSLSKKGDISYVSHIDYMRVLQRALGRAGLEVERSGGFNKHLITYCSHPLPVGVQSDSEYFMFKPAGICDLSKTQIAFQNALPQGIHIKATYLLATNPNIAGKVVECEYEAPFRGNNEDYDELIRCVDKEEVIMTFLSKGEEKSIDIKPLLYGMELINNRLILRLATGNPTLRPDKLIDFFNARLPINAKINVCETVRKNHIILNDNIRIDAEDFLEMNKLEKYSN